MKVYQDSNAVGDALCKEIVETINYEVIKKGACFIAVPGGSVLRLLAGLKQYKDNADWSKVFLFYVNHKCVPNDDPTSTHCKAKALFLDHLQFGANVFPIVNERLEVETKGHSSIAHYYQSLISSSVPMVNNLPVFDYMLLGMG